jgi:hypothetical protein
MLLPMNSCAEPGETVTVTGGGGSGADTIPPQELKIAASKSNKKKKCGGRASRTDSPGGGGGSSRDEYRETIRRSSGVGIGSAASANSQEKLRGSYHGGKCVSIK